MDVAERARIHAALGDRHRLVMVDGLMLSDRTFQELAMVAGLPGNLAAHHLRVLEAAGLIERHTSEGDQRRRYISLLRDRLDDTLRPHRPLPERVIFLCTHNSARSQFAAALWRARTGLAADSAGTEPADRVNPGAVEAAAAFGLDLRSARPKRWIDIAGMPDLVVSVCDRAHEAGVPFTGPSLHWSVPDPVVSGEPEAFRASFGSISARIEDLVAASLAHPGVEHETRPPHGERP
jgi:ArsR family transcriptional regulator, arsenate/arsenite/antimonite-responsive transcriptional repressor / arsenate reductase (thioredoxin)